ncbi:MAG TPA: prepilin-type N-terminal cleavage/methylation domain-containing protein [Armatimonadetes bacterium]|jgi:type II secretion system protein I|nr:prepilin-type N-terminal cleavage/methylation domain-containing protein [Armatimonadota bacterium]
MRGERGFTLIEMIVATLILAMGIAGALATFGAISRASGMAAEYDQAAFLAERRLAEIAVLGASALTEESGDFEDEAPGWQWEQEVVETEIEGVIELRVTVFWESGDRRREFQVSTYLPEEGAEQG